MKVIAIIGTRRKKGNVTKLCEQIFLGAEKINHQTELINLYDYQINYCIGCWACAKNGRCSQKDDFESIYKKMMDSDVIVLASPVYWGNISAIMKNFFDRHTSKMIFPLGVHGISKQTFKTKIKFALKALSNFGPKKIDERKKKFILVSASTQPFRFLSNEVPSTLKTMKIFVKKFRGKILSTLVYTDTLIKFCNKEDRILKKAFRIGLKIH